MKPALLVIDVQKQFYQSDPATSQSLREAVNNINSAIALFRARGLPIICIQHMDEDCHLVPGEEGFDLPDELLITSEDIHIHKTHGNTFVKTDLQSRLNSMGVDTVIITGYCAEYCVLATARGAEDLDLNAFLLRDCIASGSQENIRFVERIYEMLSLGVLEKVLA